MTDESLHDDVREIRSLVTQNLAKTIQIESAIWPDKGQPSLLTVHENRIKSLETWRSWLGGAWAVVTALFGYHVSHK
jgi:hypothetical protein